jgi:Raf kinase inhibitor-like YbhB/YbcL family protein
MMIRRNWYGFLVLLSLIGGIVACGSSEVQSAAQTPLELRSSAFDAHGKIPRQYTCDGNNTAPPLVWQGVPEQTRSLALIVDDPDAPRGTWVHWVLYNIPPTATGLPEGVTASSLPSGAREGLNSWKRTGYGGPCPPSGSHRYVHKLYALDTELGHLDKPSKAELEAAMQGHVLAQAKLVGTYKRQR